MIAFDASGATLYLDGLLARMAAMEPVMAEIGAHQASSIMHRIMETKTGPDGETWSPWKPSTAAHRAQNAGQGLLWDTGTMLHSITMQATGHGFEIGVGTDYAQYLQDGTPNMAARPFVGWGVADIAAVEVEMIRYLEGINP